MIPAPSWVFLRHCDACGMSVERTLTDSWTGLELCIECLYPILGRVSMSVEDDNLEALLKPE